MIPDPRQMTFADVLSPPLDPRIRVRNLRPGEVLPFSHGCEQFPALDPVWCWVAEYQGRICGILIGAGVHGTFFLLRIVVPPGSPKTTVLVLLRHVRKAVLYRGMRAWTTFLSPTPELPNEERVLRLADRYHPLCIPVCGAWVVGRV